MREVTILDAMRSKLVLIEWFYATGFEEGIRDMKPGGKRRIIIPPELGPPVSSLLLEVSLSLCTFVLSNSA